MTVYRQDLQKDSFAFEYFEGTFKDILIFCIFANLSLIFFCIFLTQNKKSAKKSGSLLYKLLHLGLLILEWMFYPAGWKKNDTEKCQK